jgi:VWFA-related protein
MPKMLKRIANLCLLVITLLSLSGFTLRAGGDNRNVRITQVDTSKFPLVTVYVSITDANGEPIEVAPTSLVLMENGQEMAPQEISGLGESNEPLTTLLVMDVSGSMNSTGKLQAAKDAAIAYVQQTRPNDLTGLLVFNTKIKYVQKITQNKDKLVNAIKDLKARDDTAMYDALIEATGVLEAYQGRKAIIALTDGMDNRSKASPDDVIQRIGPAGLSISTIGLGDPAYSHGNLAGLDEDALTSLSERAGGVYGYANDANALRTLYERYGRALQSEYAITYSSPSTLRDGVNRSLSVALKGSPASSATTEMSKYNPGGLVPEVAKPASWMVFFILIGALVLFLFLPAIVGLFTSRSQKANPKGRIKLSSSRTPHIKLKH